MTEPNNDKVKNKIFFARLIDKFVSSPNAVIIILLVIMAIMIAIVTVSLMTKTSSSFQTDNVTVVPVDDSPAVIVDKRITYNELSKQIKLILFDNNVVKDDIVENSFRVDNKAIYYIKVDIDKKDSEDLRYKLNELLNENSLKSLYSDDVNHIVAESVNNTPNPDPQRNFRLEILLEEKLVVQAAPPEDVVEVAPVETYPYGITPPAKGSGKIALLIDDAGMNLNLADRVTKLKIPITVAILPHQAHSEDTAELIRNRGKSVFLHFPMEPLSYPSTDPGEGAVLVNMPELLIAEITKKNVENLGKIDGANNHMGSAFTADEAKMSQVLKSLAPYTKNFVDSNTNPKSVAYKVCSESGFKCGLNKKFLDNDNSHEYITGKLYEAAELARRNGNVIAIGHLRHNTIDVLEEVVPVLEKLGYKFVTVNSVLQ